jgi:hypothetical protein
MSQPEKVTPSYLGPAGQQAPPSIYAILKDQVMAPQYRDDNLRYVLVHLLQRSLPTIFPTFYHIKSTCEE